MVAEAGDHRHVADVECLGLRPRVAAELHPVRHAIVGEEVVHHRLALDAIHQMREALRVVVVVVVRDQREVQQRSHILRPAVVQVDGERLLGRLHDQAHVVHVPYRRMVDVRDDRLLHLPQHLLERRLEPPKHGEAPRRRIKLVLRQLDARSPIRGKLIRLDGVDLALAQVQLRAIRSIGSPRGLCRNRRREHPRAEPSPRNLFVQHGNSFASTRSLGEECIT